MSKYVLASSTDHHVGFRIAQVVQCQTCDWKVAGLIPGRSSRRISPRVAFLCWISFSVCSTPVLLQWHEKDPDHSAESAGGRLPHACTFDSQSGLTMLFGHSRGTCHGNKLTCNSSGSACPVVSACWANVDWFLASENGIDAHELISNQKTTTTKMQAGNDLLNLP